MAEQKEKGMNQVTIVGNISEPKLTYTQKGVAFLQFGLATNRKMKDQDEPETTWFRVKVWDKFAENMAAEIEKGDRLVIVGRIEMSEFEDKEGSTQKTVAVVAEEGGRTLRWVRD